MSPPNMLRALNLTATPQGQYKANKVRLLGVSTAKRVNAVAEVPTIAESALPGFENYTWFGLFAPKGLEPQIVERINAAIKIALDSPAIRQKLLDAGNTPRYETVEQFRATVKSNRAKWAEVVKASGATVD
jgi:tripartite-type tricarboxylate transporter receptor subunit TctC